MTLARASIQRLARELAAVDPDREVCRECDGDACSDCDFYGSHPITDAPAYRLPQSRIQAARDRHPANPYSASALREAHRRTA